MAGAFDLVYREVRDTVYRSVISSFATCTMSNGPWVSGGSVRKVWHGLDWLRQDVDFFFSSQEGFDRFDRDIRIRFDLERPRGVWQDLLCKSPKPSITCFETNNAKTYNIDETWLSTTRGYVPRVCSDTGLDISRPPLKVQAIRKQYHSSIEDLFSSFDFTACQFATDGNIMVATREAIEDCHNMVLRPVNANGNKPAKSRIVKYTAYGFSPNDAIMSDLLKAMSNNETLEVPDDY